MKRVHNLSIIEFSISIILTKLEISFTNNEDGNIMTQMILFNEKKRDINMTMAGVKGVMEDREY